MIDAMTGQDPMASALDLRPTLVPQLRPPAREVALTDQLGAASRQVTELEVKVNRLELELIAERALREELERELAALRAWRRIVDHDGPAYGRRASDKR